MRRRANIDFDTSLSHNFDFIEQFASEFGAERVAFGTNLYSHPVGRRISRLLPQILESALGRDAKSQILSGNVRPPSTISSADSTTRTGPSSTGTIRQS
jgi:predicted TIM-barrel fold metal-dependent hydrolase